ncbi:hypothetical protein [Methylobacterium organophilum]|uniref:Uncharacterized protein n=1 Tax=Methylobacterium organophilum TaxID=410 RepID=A0ABQ4T560_METOR|nr:hypothetical protein [Methylobacterium organophilum]UMY19732.1 hypothetical protein MMB17_10730 [Methylobacterium organophilum]GJE26378.1 hypothetical protein LKMONMHP_1229 [Methylobacterium organophilum]
MSAVEVKYLTVVECPVIFPGENEYAMSSFDMLPRLGITRGLESRHVKVLDNRIVMVCIWKSSFCARLFFDAAWTEKAAVLWPDTYQFRLEPIENASAA